MENFNDIIKGVQSNWKFSGETPVIIDFYATWCGPCKALAPTLHKIAEEYEGKIKVLKVDIDQNQSFAETCEVQSVPTLFLIRRDGTFQRMIGAQPYNVLKNAIETELL